MNPGTMLLPIIVVLLYTCAHATEKELEKRSHELATWLLSQLSNDDAKPKDTTSVTCPSPDVARNTIEKYFRRVNMPKRNSELINSLLRLSRQPGWDVDVTKRNSELINTLMRLPKNVDYGRY